MPLVLACLVVAALTIGGGLASAGPPCEEGDLAVTIQIHDYVRLRSDALARAREIVTRVYEKIGIRTEWIGVVRPRERQTTANRDDRARGIGQITVLVLTPQMADRGGVAKNVLGFAAVPDEGIGRIAYVVYDRIRQAASAALADETALFGFVMAHEIGHLMLPRGSQAANGVMKGHLELDDLRRLDPHDMEFTPPQAERIRATVGLDAGNPRYASADTCAPGGVPTAVPTTGRSE